MIASRVIEILSASVCRSEGTDDRKSVPPSRVIGSSRITIPIQEDVRRSHTVNHEEGDSVPGDRTRNHTEYVRAKWLGTRQLSNRFYTTRLGEAFSSCRYGLRWHPSSDIFEDSS